jgi:hypothetical protein
LNTDKLKENRLIKNIQSLKYVDSDGMPIEIFNTKLDSIDDDRRNGRSIRYQFLKDGLNRHRSYLSKAFLQYLKREGTVLFD